MRTASWLTVLLRRIWVSASYTALCVCSAIALFVSSASAHTLKTDGTISGVLHIQPNDAPTSGSPTEYILFLDDSSKQFSLAGCDCTLTIKEPNKTLGTIPLQLNTQGVIGGTVTFPRADAYEMTFQGKPMNGATFQPFTLTYLERVLPGKNTSLQLPNPSIIAGGVAVFLALIALLLKVRYNTLQRR